MAEAVAEAIEVTKKKRSLGKLLLLVINVLLFLSGAGFFTLTKLGLLSIPQRLSSYPSASAPATATPAPAPPSDANLVSLRMRPFVVNLSGDHGRRYLRVVLELEVRGNKVEQAVEAKMAQIRDRLIFLLSSKTYDEISAVQGKYQLQDEITHHLNETLGGPYVAKTYFTEFIVQ